MLLTAMVIALTQLAPGVTTGIQAIPIHGEAEWIMRDPAIQWCCGPRECGVVPAGGVIAEGSGWKVPETGQRFHLGDPYTYWSKDEKMWWCRVKGVSGAPMQGVVQCLFVPKLGS
jgi:hypothetical protein